MPKHFASRWLPVAVVLAAAPAFVAVTLARPQSAAMKPARAASTAEPAANRAWPTAAVADPTAIGFTKAGLDALDARMQKSVADGDTAGMTILLLRHGQVADFKSFGKATEATPMALDSLFRIYSMSKPITGVAMMQLYEQGKWKLDDPITKYVPELAGLKELTWGADGKAVIGADGKPVLATPKKPATMRQLMSHTAGFGYGLSGDDPVNKAFREDRVLASKDLDELIARVANIPLLYEPGTEVVVLGRRRHPGLHRAEALGTEVRRLPEGARHRTDRDDRYRVLRHARSEGALHRCVSLGQRSECAGR